MKKSIMVLAVAAAAAVIAMTGCTTVPGAITAQSKPLEQNGYVVVAPEVSATELQGSVMGFGVGDVRGSMSRRLYQSALAQAPGADALIEYTMDAKHLYLVFANLSWYTITGTAVKSK